MAVYSTFFLACPTQLLSAFPGWKPPLPKPVTRKSFNPFTREEITVTSRDPEWDHFNPDDMELLVPRVVAIEGDYESYLENRIPPFVQSQPHWCSKNLTIIELDALIDSAIKTASSKLESALYAHPSLGCSLEQFPDNFTEHIRTASANDLHTIADQWAKTMSTPEYTHSVSGERLSDGWSADDAFNLLSPIAEIVKQHSAGQSLYILIEL